MQRFEDGMPRKDDVYVRTPTNPLPDIDELNAKIPQDQWDLGINGKPRPPWVHSYAAYLLDPIDASIATYINSSGGAQAGIRPPNDRANGCVRSADARFSDRNAWQPPAFEEIQQARPKLHHRWLARAWWRYAVRERAEVAWAAGAGQADRQVGQ